MIRLFEQHQARQVKELDGMWEVTVEESLGRQIPGQQNLEGRKYSMPVPGCLEQHPDFLNFRGRVSYSRKFYLAHSGSVRLEFKGVSHTGDVWLDGKKIAHHYNAFTPFSTTVTHLEQGEHEIKVLVDNSFGEHSALHIPNDYYTYGGITRPVLLESIHDMYIKGIRFTPYKAGQLWKARVEISVRNLSSQCASFDLTASLDSVQMTREAVSLEADSETTLVFDQEFPNVLPWSHKSPQLYFLNAVLSINGVPVDDLIERVGFRTVETVDGKLLLNGEPVFLKGFNRHEDYADFGCAIPLQLMVKDMNLMQDMGVNAVRTCHYPNDERFLDLCDERGILVWEENHARGFTLKEMLNPHFEAQCRDCIQEMIENHYNHPGIVIWGILNECASETEEGRKMYAEQYAQIKGLDQSRPTTSATCRHFTDICLDLPDIVSFNMYSGWYEDVDPKKRNEQEIDWIQKAGGAGKPIIVSEMGAAAIYGCRDRSHCKWSEERQADIIRENLEVYMNHQAITGVFIWQFADCRVTEEGGWFSTRARCHNNKGVVDEYRRPKLAYDTIKEMFLSAPQ